MGINRANIMCIYPMDLGCVQMARVVREINMVHIGAGNDCYLQLTIGDKKVINGMIRGAVIRVDCPDKWGVTRICQFMESVIEGVV